MTAKVWSAGEIRALARRTVKGRQAITTARGAYFRALLETAQVELGAGVTSQSAQLTALKTVHRRFYLLVREAIATDKIILQSGIARKGVGLERNRRLNFARSAYGTIKRWLRAAGHDLMKLDSVKVTKSQLLSEAPPTRKHALTPQRVQKRAGKLVENLLGFTRQIAKVDHAQAVAILNEAMDCLAKQLAAEGVAAARKGVHRTYTAPAREISQRRAA